MTFDRKRAPGADVAAEEARPTTRDANGSFVAAQAAALGVSPGLLQRKIQRRADERRGGEGGARADARGELPQSTGGGANEDSHVAELKTKVGALVNQRFGGDYKAAFDHYDGSHDGGVNRDELVQLLADAGVGNAFTRGMWADGIMEKLDLDKDGRIQWSEFQNGIH